MLQDYSLRTQLIKEIIDIPENKLRELYNFLHSYSKIKSTGKGEEKKLSFSGIWKDLPDDVFNAFIKEINYRRTMAFSKRKAERQNERSIN